MVSTENHPHDMRGLLEDWQLEDLAWSLSIRLMRISHEDFASYVQRLPEDTLAA